MRINSVTLLLRVITLTILWTRFSAQSLRAVVSGRSAVPHCLDSQVDELLEIPNIDFMLYNIHVH